MTRIICLMLCFGLVSLPATHRVTATLLEPQQTDQAHQALSQGRKLLKRGHADQALVQLQTALRLFTSANNASGIAASHNELGDLYMRQGQYPVALDHYQKAFEGFVNVKPPDTQAASSGVGRVAGAEAAQGVNAAASIADDKFNANLMLAKIGDVNFRLGKVSDAMTAYGRMQVKQPESTAQKVTRRFGIGSIIGGVQTQNVSVAAPTSVIAAALEAKKELDEYRNSIVFSSYELGMGRLAYVSNDFETE